jgi:hypothetical protein
MNSTVGHGGFSVRLAVRANADTQACFDSDTSQKEEGWIQYYKYYIYNDSLNFLLYDILYVVVV